MMKILQTRDADFDMCKAFLLITMFVIHACQSFQQAHYNTHATYFVTIAFVFLAGFTMAAVYERHMGSFSFAGLRLVSSRAAKIWGIFLVSNLAVILLEPRRTGEWAGITIGDAFLSSVLLNRQGLFAFDVLVPIALTFLLAGLIMPLIGGRARQVIVLVLCFLLLVVAESYRILNYYGLKLAIVGIMGCLAALLLRRLDWGEARRRLATSGMLSGLALSLAAYFWLCVSVMPRWPASVSVHLIPTAAILLGVYTLSIRYSLAERASVRYLNRVLGRQMLFAYLFHILLLNVLMLFIPMKCLSAGGTAAMASFVCAATIVACDAMARSCERAPVIGAVYSSIFK